MAHSCSHNACTVSMRTAHRRERHHWWPVAFTGIALMLAAGAWLIGGGLGGVL